MFWAQQKMEKKNIILYIVCKETEMHIMRNCSLNWTKWNLLEKWPNFLIWTSIRTKRIKPNEMKTKMKRKQCSCKQLIYHIMGVGECVGGRCGKTNVNATQTTVMIMSYLYWIFFHFLSLSLDHFHSITLSLFLSVHLRRNRSRKMVMRQSPMAFEIHV